VGIVLYGFRLTLSDVAQIGATGLLADAVMIGTTFVLAIWVGGRVFKLDRADAILIGAGSAVCGAAAVMAASSVVKGNAAQTTVAVATVVLFGTIAMFVYPLLYPMLAEAFAAHPGSFGIYVGSTVHEVAQAIAVGSMLDATTAEMALVAKLGRVAMLGPVLLLLAAWYASLQSKDLPSSKSRLVIPWFALGFLAASGLNSMVDMPPLLLQALNYAGSLFLGIAMAALGLGAQIGVMRSAGARPVLLAMLLAVWLLAGGLVVNLTLLGLR
jgi:uncharacterized integral membrane protein (TIGR00698 family)